MSDERVLVQTCLNCAQQIENTIKTMIGAAANAKEAEKSAIKPEEPKTEVVEHGSGRPDIPQGRGDQTESESEIPR